MEFIPYIPPFFSCFDELFLVYVRTEKLWGLVLVCFGVCLLVFNTVEKREVQNWRLYVSEVILNLKDGDHKIQILEKSSVQMLF